MLKNGLCLLAGLCSMCFFQMISAAEVKPVDRSAQYNDHPAYNFHGEIDKTDIYAIPLDESEEEQNEELSEFEKESKKYEESQMQKNKQLKK